jgi:hypothetical protein
MIKLAANLRIFVRFKVCDSRRNNLTDSTPDLGHWTDGVVAGGKCGLLSFD